MTNHQWGRLSDPNNIFPIHVFPIDDIREHITDSAFCPCLPVTLRGEEGAAEIVRHNSYDGREIGEVCRKSLDALGAALASHHHQWTADERVDYEHAIDILNMHYPVKP